MDDWHFNEQSFGKSQKLQHFKPIMPKFYKAWQVMSSSHLVLMTLHMWFTMSIEQDK